MSNISLMIWQMSLFQNLYQYRTRLFMIDKVVNVSMEPLLEGFQLASSTRSDLKRVKLNEYMNTNEWCFLNISEGFKPPFENKCVGVGCTLDICKSHSGFIHDLQGYIILKWVQNKLFKYTFLWNKPFSSLWTWGLPCMFIHICSIRFGPFKKKKYAEMFDLWSLPLFWFTGWSTQIIECI